MYHFEETHLIFTLSACHVLTTRAPRKETNNRNQGRTRARAKTSAALSANEAKPAWTVHQNSVFEQYRKTMFAHPIGTKRFALRPLSTQARKAHGRAKKAKRHGIKYAITKRKTPKQNHHPEPWCRNTAADPACACRALLSCYARILPLGVSGTAPRDSDKGFTV